MKKQIVTLRESGFFSDLVCDFAEGKEDLDPFCHRRPSPENLLLQAEEKAASFAFREELHQRISHQYNQLSINRKEKIDKLLESRTFTITTGHQLSLFTGPLYFIYKIVHTINIAKDLNERYPDYHFIPVYWMASEDHDFDEIQSFKIGEKSFKWQREQEGAVGRMDTAGLDLLAEELKSALGAGAYANELVALFENAYCQKGNLAEATTRLVDTLFGDQGLLIIDGDDRLLKSLMIPVFEKELREAFAHKHTENLSKKLDTAYFAQVHVRDCNLFYLAEKHRGRFVKTTTGFAIEGTSIERTVEEWVEELHRFPERFSPNVVMRPLYQESVLPNLAYIGGGGEIAYWLQLREMFKAALVPFPILWLRQSFLFIPKAIQRKIERLDLSTALLWQKKRAIEKKIIEDNTDLDLSLDGYENRLEQLFSELEQVAQQTDQSMMGAVKAQRQKQLNGLSNLKRKLLRAEKRRLDIEIRMLDEVFNYCFPGNGLQERSQNFSALIATFGKTWWMYLWNQNPWESGIMVFTEPTENEPSVALQNQHDENK